MLGQTASIGEVVLGLGLLGGAMPALDNLMPASQSIKQDVSDLFLHQHISLYFHFPEGRYNKPMLGLLDV